MAQYQSVFYGSRKKGHSSQIRKPDARHLPNTVVSIIVGGAITDVTDKACKCEKDTSDLTTKRELGHAGELRRKHWNFWKRNPHRSSSPTMIHQRSCPQQFVSLLYSFDDPIPCCWGRKRNCQLLLYAVHANKNDRETWKMSSAKSFLNRTKKWKHHKVSPAS